MLTKKTLSTLAVGALFAAATPAFADPPRWAPAHGYRGHERQVFVERHHFHQPAVREVIVRRPVVVQRTVVVERPVYYSEPAYSSEPVYAPAPNMGTIGGAIIGAALGHQIGKGDGRDAATIAGAVIGGILGSGRY